MTYRQNQLRLECIGIEGQKRRVPTDQHTPTNSRRKPQR